jgi:hypothetical protein
VAKHPGRADDRFELCRALLEPSRGDDRAAACREAIGHADRLLAEQPKAAEYQLLRAQAGFELGVALVERARTATEADRAELLVEAERELRAAAQVDVEPARGRRGPDRQWAFPLQARRWLVHVYELGGRRPEAVRELNGMLDQVEQSLGERGGAMRFAELLGRPGPEAPGRDSLRSLVQKLGDPALQERLRALAQRLPSPRPDGPPPEPRRNR